MLTPRGAQALHGDQVIIVITFFGIILLMKPQSRLQQDSGFASCWSEGALLLGALGGQRLGLICLQPSSASAVPGAWRVGSGAGRISDSPGRKPTRLLCSGRPLKDALPLPGERCRGKVPAHCPAPRGEPAAVCEWVCPLLSFLDGVPLVFVDVSVVVLPSAPACAEMDSCRLGVPGLRLPLLVGGPTFHSLPSGRPHASTSHHPGVPQPRASCLWPLPVSELIPTPRFLRVAFGAA